MSLSLEPPLVAFAPSLKSDTWPRIEKVGRGCVNFLSEGQRELGIRFAERTQDRFDGVSYSLSRSGMPVLEGALAYLDIEISDVYPGGDHYLVVAGVTDLGIVNDLDPLIFHRSVYRRGFGIV